MIERHIMLRTILKRLYQIIYKWSHKDCIFEHGVEFGSSCTFLGNNLVSRNSFLNHVEMGYMSYCGDSCHLISAKIGKYTSIGPDVKISIGRHPTDIFVSTHPIFYSKDNRRNKNYISESKYDEVKFAYEDSERKFAVNIGNDVWIGAGVRIIDGVTIGDGAVIGANSLVISDVPPYTIVVGTPAKAIKKRFSEDTVEKILEFQWWEKDEKWIVNNAEYFDNIDLFFKRVNDLGDKRNEFEN